MKKYLFYSTILSVFSEAFVVRYIIDIKLFYIVVLSNLVILVILKSLHVNLKLILFYGFLFISGILTVLLGTNVIQSFLNQFFGIVVVSLFFYNFFSFYQGQVQIIFKEYTNICYYVAIIGILFFVFNLLKGEIVPIQSIMLEPAHYATISLPAFFYALKNQEFPRHIWKVLLASIILSGSSLGFLGLGLSILLLPNQFNAYRIAGSFLAIVILFVVLYFSYDPLKLRVNDSVGALTKKDLTGVNLSTFSLVSNFFVAVQSLESNPVLGSGLGSHEFSHTKHIGKITGIEGFKEYININSKDAASLFIRIMSEFGILGLILLSVFLIRNYVRYSSAESSSITSLHLVSKAVILYFFCKLLREGHYFPPELYFFVFSYVFVSREKNKIILI